MRENALAVVYGPRGAKNLPEHAQKQPDHRLQGPKIGGNGGMRILEKNIQKQCIRRIRIVAHYVYVEVRWVKCLGSVE